MNQKDNEQEEVLERVTDAFVAVDRDWRIVYMNAAAERISRRPRRELLGCVLWDEFPDLRNSVFEEKYRRALDEQVPVEFESYYEPLETWVAVKAYPSSSGLSIYAQDITERKKSELALAISEARYRLIVENVNEGICLVDSDYRIAWFNERAAAMWGTGIDPARGKQLQEFIYEEDLPLLRQRMAERRQGHKASYDIRMRRADGTVFWALVRIAPIMGEDGSFQGALGLMTDITDRKRFEAELYAQRERFHVTLSSIGDAVIATDDRGVVTFMNRVAEELTGWPLADASGRPLEEVFKIVNEYSREPVESPVAKVLREGKVVGLANHTSLIARDGSERPIDDSGAPIRDAAGVIIGVVLVFRDNTERARAEAEMREAARRKDEFLAMLGHELRNPLAPIATALEIIRLGANDPAAIARARQIIERQTQHMTRLVDDLLDVSRITRGQITLRSTEVSLASLVNGAVETVRPLLLQRNQRFEQHIPNGAVVLNVDPTRITQVLANLLNNASKFTPDGGSIKLFVEHSGDQLRFRIRDDGAGIAPERLESVFEPFVQLGTGVGRAQAGLGIGLTLVKTLVELHGGRVTALSEGVGKGSEFSVVLPLLSSEERKAG
jgi:PAS domain S-box-containing protein